MAKISPEAARRNQDHAVSGTGPRQGLGFRGRYRTLGIAGNGEPNEMDKKLATEMEPRIV